MKYINESLLSIADTGYALRFLKLLVTNWQDTGAYKEGLIDKKGKRLKDVKIETKKQKAAYTIFHRLVYNIKRLTGGSRFTSIISALYLIKEETGMSNEEIISVLNEVLEPGWDQTIISEIYTDETNRLNKGIYILKQDIAHHNTGEYIAKKNTKVEVKEHLEPIDTILGHNIYQVEHILTKQKMYVSTQDISR